MANAQVRSFSRSWFCPAPARSPHFTEIPGW